MTKRHLWSFNFRPEGFNDVWAGSRTEAIAEAKRLFPGFAHRVDEGSFVEHATKESQDAYWDSLPLMD